MLTYIRKKIQRNYKGITRFRAALGTRWPAWWLEGLGESSQTTGGPAHVDRETSNAPTCAESLDWEWRGCGEAEISWRGGRRKSESRIFQNHENLFFEFLGQTCLRIFLRCPRMLPGRKRLPCLPDNRWPMKQSRKIVL